MIHDFSWNIDSLDTYLSSSSRVVGERRPKGTKKNLQSYKRTMDILKMHSRFVKGNKYTLLVKVNNVIYK